MRRATAPTESTFVERRRADWDALDALVQQATNRGLKKLDPLSLARLPALYRDVCADLSRAQAARYGAPLVEYLEGLTASAHGLVYGKPSRALASRLAEGAPEGRAASLFGAFPRAVRRRWRAVAIAAALFFLPFVVGLLAAKSDPTFAFRIAPQSMLEPLTEAYAKGFADGRTPGEGTLMAGFYVHNNVGIALRCFALGIFGGLGSAIYLVQNGLSIGAILGYVASQGAGANILTFVVGHGAFELGAIVLAGAAGLSVGWSLVAPGEKTRAASLQDCARDVVMIVAGAAVMLLIAAGIEAFWSASSVPSSIKRSVGLALAILITVYLSLAGRRAR
ncbi:MAG: stage II sporulation protein M [Deltaproteobacteria bacterium]|nr:stage II sporulation protein M [Deltaproteobacteria bacterium]